MALARPFLIAAILTAVLVILGVLAFLQSKDPMALWFGIRLAAVAWIVAAVVYAWQRGIPVRIVADERKQL